MRTTAPRPGRQVALRTAITAMMTALVCVATMAFTIYVPATKGYFNLVKKGNIHEIIALCNRAPAPRRT